MNLLEDIKMSLLNFNFVMIYIIHKMLLLLKNHVNYLRNSIFECFLRRVIFVLLKKAFFLNMK